MRRQQQQHLLREPVQWHAADQHEQRESSGCQRDRENLHQWDFAEWHDRSELGDTGNSSHGAERRILGDGCSGGQCSLGSVISLFSFIFFITVRREVSFVFFMQILLMFRCYTP